MLRKIFFNFGSFMSGNWASKGPGGSSPDAFFFAMSFHISLSPSQASCDLGPNHSRMASAVPLVYRQ